MIHFTFTVLATYPGCQIAHTGLHYGHCFDLTVDAGDLVAYSATLTAVTFAAIAILASRPRPPAGAEDKRRLGDTLVMFLAAFIAFSVTTYLFTSAASEIYPLGRAGLIAYCGSLALGLALMQLLYGLRQLVQHLELPSAGSFSTFMFYGAALLILIYEAITTIDTVGLGEPEARAWSSTTGTVVIAFGIGVLAVGVVSVLSLCLPKCPKLQARLAGKLSVTRRCVSRLAKPCDWLRQRWLTVVAAASVVYVIAVAVIAGIWEEHSYWVAFAPTGYQVLFSCFCAVSIGFISLIAQRASVKQATATAASASGQTPE